MIGFRQWLLEESPRLYNSGAQDLHFHRLQCNPNNMQWTMSSGAVDLVNGNWACLSD